MHANLTIVSDDSVPYAKLCFATLGKVTLKAGRDIKREDLINADILIVRSRTQVNAELLQGTKVKFVGSAVVGLDHIDQVWLKQNDIHFYSAQGCNANSVAQFVIASLMELSQRQQFNLQDKTIGIIGVGHVGSKLANYAKLLGIKTLLNDPPRQQNENLVDFVDLDTALKADIISIHTPLTYTGEHPSYHLINNKKLAKINSNQILINAARGGIIEESKWANTKTQANLIDAWENEPNINEDLYKTATLATPHIAGHSLDAKIAGTKMVYQALCFYLKTTEDKTWQQHLPLKPPPLELTNNQNKEQTLNQLFKLAHNPFDDHKNMQQPTFKAVLNSFENYRRNYPEYREWHQHRVKNIPEQLKNVILSLGFKQ